MDIEQIKLINQVRKARREQLMKKLYNKTITDKERKELIKLIKYPKLPR